MEGDSFIINIVRLKLGTHELEYDVTGEFLNFFYPDLVEEADLSVGVMLKKSETMIEMDFDIQGELSLVCDRSLEIYTESISKEERLFFKFGEQAEELSESVVIIPHHQHEIDISQFVYEFVALSIPMKKLHPSLREEPSEEGDDDESNEMLIYSSAQKNEENNESSEPVDPRWEALKHINKN